MLPTETVYGLAALPTVPGATAAVFTLKGRPETVPLAVLVDDFAQVREWVESVPDSARRLGDAYWPGPLTMVLRASPMAAPLGLGGSGITLGVRCPDHDFVRALARRVGPIASTSANRHGEPTPHTAADAAAALHGDVDIVVDGGRCDGTPSTVVDLSGDEPRILRDGAVPAAVVFRTAGFRPPPA